MLCESLVLSHFSYCNVVYFPCIDKDTTMKIQRVQNSCIRYIFGIRKFQHISHKFHELGWLNMSNRFSLQAGCLIHNIIHSKTPPYLLNRIKFRTDVHNLNLRNVMCITPPIHKSSFFERSFTFTIYKIYNSIPKNITQLNCKAFKNNYFTLLYKKQYDNRSWSV